jgi:hypothetical protein
MSYHFSKLAAAYDAQTDGVTQVDFVIGGAHNPLPNHVGSIKNLSKRYYL